jgi:hypothetical protein
VDWFAATSQLVVGLAWPVTVLVLVLAFRREIRARLKAVREVKYPGGSITMEVAELAARVEQSREDEAVVAQPLETSLPLAGSDAQLSIAHARLNVEKELFRLSWLATGHPNEAKSWGVTRHIDELERAGVLKPSFAANLRDFVEISNKILRGADLEEEAKLGATVTGATLAAQLYQERQVRRMERDFQAHGLWHLHRHVDVASKKYYWWSAVAATMPEFDYSYEIYREAAERHNRREIIQENPSDALYVLSLEEFVCVLEFRESELLRLIDAWSDAYRRQGDTLKNFQEDNEWQWPPEWGNLGWSGPILREHPSVYATEEELMKTRTALNRYRQQLLPRAAGPAPGSSSLP